MQVLNKRLVLLNPVSLTTNKQKYSFSILSLFCRNLFNKSELEPLLPWVVTKLDAWLQTVTRMEQLWMQLMRVACSNHTARQMKWNKMLPLEIKSLETTNKTNNNSRNRIIYNNEKAIHFEYVALRTIFN